MASEKTEIQKEGRKTRKICKKKKVNKEVFAQCKYKSMS